MLLYRHQGFSFREGPKIEGGGRASLVLRLSCVYKVEMAWKGGLDGDWHDEIMFVCVCIFDWN